MIRFSELVSALTPSQWTQAALVLFVSVFVAVLVRHGGRRRREEHASCAQMPLADDVPTGGAS